MRKYIYIKNKKYYLYGGFSSWKEAYNIARLERRYNKKVRYFIVRVEEGIVFPYERYYLYLSNYGV